MDCGPPRARARLDSASVALQKGTHTQPFLSYSLGALGTERIGWAAVARFLRITATPS